MNIIQTALKMSVIGVDVSRDHMDICCRPSGTSIRLSNDKEGHDRLVALAREKNALVGFEATGGCEWPVWERLVKEGVRVRQYPPGRIRHYCIACGHMAKSDKNDAKGIALFMQHFPDAGRELPSDVLRELRDHVTFRAQIVETRKRWKNEIEARNRQGREAMFNDMAGEQVKLCDRQIAEIEERIQRIIVSDAMLHKMAIDLTTIRGVGFVTASTLIAEMPELGLISGRKVAALIGVAPYARDSGKKKGKRSISGGRANVRTVLYQAGMSAMRCNPALAAFAQRLKDAGKPHKVVVIAVARKLAVIANAMIRDGTQWDPEANGKASAESKPVATSGEKPVGEARPDEACNSRRESSGGQAIEPEVSARGGSSRGLGRKPADRSGKTLV